MPDKGLFSPPRPGNIPRTLRLTALIFFLSFLFREFFTPFNQFGEPLPLIALELTFWAVIALAGAFAISGVMEWQKAALGESH